MTNVEIEQHMKNDKKDDDSDVFILFFHKKIIAHLFFFAHTHKTPQTEQHCKSLYGLLCPL